MFMLSVWPVLILLPTAVAFLTLSLPQPVKFPAERCTDAPVNSIFSGSLTHLLSLLCVLMKSFHMPARKNKQKRLKGFKFPTFAGRFQVASWQRRG